MKKNLFIAISVMAILCSSHTEAKCSGCTQGNAMQSQMHTKQMQKGSQTIVEIASEHAEFSTLVTALKAAGLVQALSEQGPFTVFAPTNEAFSQLPAGTVENLLKPQNKEQLVNILTYHVVPGKVLSGDLKTMKVKALNGEELSIVVNGSHVTVNGVKVVKPDIEASNGVIHVIDGVLIPKN